MDGQAELRTALERDYSADHAELLGSGTQALQVAIALAMRLVGSDVVALPAFTCFDVATAAVGARARIRLYDLDPDTLTPDLASLERLLQLGTRIVVITPLYGLPVDWDATAALLARYGALAIEDAAQGNHATWRGRMLGSLAPIGILSFGRGKGWTGGAGGALLLRDQPPWRDLGNVLGAVYRGRTRRGRVADVATLGRLVAQWALGRPSWYALPLAIPWLGLGETVYHEPVTPRPMTRAASTCIAMTGAAAVQEATLRRKRATALLAVLGEMSRIRTVRPVPESRPGYLRLPLRLSAGLSSFVTLETRRLGIAASYPATLGVLPSVQSRMDDARVNYPGAEELVRTLCTVPTHSRVTVAEQSEIIQCLSVYDRASS